MSAPDRPDYSEFAYGEGYYGGQGEYEALIECSEGSSAPLLVVQYDAARIARTQAHDSVSGGTIIVLASGRDRSGRLGLIYRTATEARHALDLHALPVLFTLTRPGLPDVDMTYAVTGAGARMTPDATRKVWHVEVEYQEVSP